MKPSSTARATSSSASPSKSSGPDFASQKMFIENFIGEAKLVADLIHTNIVQTYHLGEANGVCFIAMELIRGVNLEQFHPPAHRQEKDVAEGTRGLHHQPRRARAGLRACQDRQGRQAARHRPSRRQLQKHHDRVRGRREADRFRHRQGARAFSPTRRAKSSRARPIT